jgi:hypothetical protein
LKNTYVIAILGSLKMIESLKIFSAGLIALMVAFLANKAGYGFVQTMGFVALVSAMVGIFSGCFPEK